MNQRDGRWQPGTVILQYEYWRHKLVAVRPVTVVEDTEALLALYVPAGAPFLFGRWDAPSRTQLPVAERLRVYLSPDPPVLEQRIVRSHVLTLNPPGAHHSFKLFWDHDWNLKTWYVNLELPFQRISGGIVHRDLFLDLVVTPDLAWTWKDEDEFEALRAAGGLSAEECRLIQAEGLRMVERIEARAWPFGSPWPNWYPDPAWPAPSLPPDWRPPIELAAPRTTPSAPA